MLLPKKQTGIEAHSNSRPHLQMSRPATWLRVTMIVAVVASGFALMTVRSRGAAATGSITGTVFQDYNGNGVRDTSAQLPNNGIGNIGTAIDNGVGGVTVTAYTPAGAVAGSAVTAGSGDYSINTVGSTGPYRVEFTGIPAEYFSTKFGANSGTSVQVVPDGGSTGVNLGLVHPADFSQSNPNLAVPRYVKGAATTAAAAIVGFPYTAGSASVDPNTPTSDFDLPGLTTVARHEQVGATWGLAWSRFERRIYAGAFMKRYTGIGPGGTGAIYRIDPLTQTVTLYADLNAIFGAGTAGANPHNFVDAYDNGNVSWNAVGKVGLGGLAISDDGTKLYVVNLANRTLYEIPLGVVPTAGNIRTSAVPLNPPGCPSADDVRPFALQYYRGQVYVGLTCTAESTTAGGTVDGNPAQMMAYVYTVNPVTLGFAGAPVVQFPLNYPRTCADSAQLPVCNSGLWRAWTPIYKNMAELPISPFIRRVVFPQPWLTAIDFDRGNLVLGIRDRLGDQTGLASPDNPGRPLTSLYFGVGAGDILRACGNPGAGWSLESNGRCGGLGTGPQNNGEGPGNGEYYFKDDSPIYNDESTDGGQLQVPGFPESVAGVIHPVPYVPTSNDDTIFDAGIRWFTNATGGTSKSFRVINDDLTLVVFFGKANGLGDIAALVDPPVSEIGNFVWYDLNKNGIQDPNEPPIPGVTVSLYQGVTLLATTVTNAAGQYYFNGSNVAGGILPGVAYELRVSLADGALGGKLLTLANAGTDLHDSDSTAVGGNAVVAASVPVLGANDHTLDFGFADPVFDADLSITKRVAQKCVEPGSNVTYIVTVTNNGPAVATGVVVTDDLPGGLIVGSVTPSQGTCNALDPMTCNLGSLGVGLSATITIVETVPQNPPSNTFTNQAAVTGNEPDPNLSNNHAQATACLLIPGNPDTPVGPGDPFPTGTLNDQKPGSVLFYNYYTSSPSTPNLQNTRINMTNTNPSQFVFVHLFFVDGGTCGISDRFICLTANQTMSFLLSDQDPGTTGYLVGVAVDDVLGCPITFNYLIGDAFIKTTDGHQANLAAESLASIPAQRTGPSCDGTSVSTDLVFDGSLGNYERVPRVLAASSVLDYASGNRGLLIINRFGGDFLTSAYTIPSLFGQLFDNQETSASWSHPPAGCQLVRMLSDSFPNTVPRFSTHIGPGTTGWLKLFSPVDVGLMGAIINYNANVASSNGAYNQGRNLHKLTFATSETIRIPVFPPI